MKKIAITGLLSFFFIFDSAAQMQTNLEVANSTFVSSTQQLPFWMWANNDGKIDGNNSLLNLSEASFTGRYGFNNPNMSVKAGATLVAGFGNNDSYFQPNQLFSGINLNNWELNIGLYHEETKFAGLSTSNGNMANSRNARPYPKIGISVSKYKPLPFIGNFLSFKGEYNEGLLNDNRYVEQTHLHHKSFYLKFHPARKFTIETGFEHFAMWGGTSSNHEIGKLPQSFNAYWKYIRGANGGSDFLETDQLNVAGNSYGTYQVTFTQIFKSFDASINISHPFEDYSGINWRNWPDNIIGLYIEMGKPNKFLTHFLYEFTNTRQQGISDSLYVWIENEQHWYRVHDDNYYNHGVYRSGVTYYGKTMGSPLFKPVIERDGISMGIESTRFFAHHFGAKGNLSDYLAWQAMFTYMEHFGTYGKPYGTVHKQVSFIVDLAYSQPVSPFDLFVSLAADKANIAQNVLGAKIGARYRF